MAPEIARSTPSGEPQHLEEGYFNILAETIYINIASSM
jgi:hypothetical protein